MCCPLVLPPSLVPSFDHSLIVLSPSYIVAPEAAHQAEVALTNPTQGGANSHFS